MFDWTLLVYVFVILAPYFALRTAELNRDVKLPPLGVPGPNADLVELPWGIPMSNASDWELGIYNDGVTHHRVNRHITHHAMTRKG